MYDDYDSSAQCSQRDVPLFPVLESIVEKCNCLPFEDPGGIFKAQTVLSQILPALPLVPLELHDSKIHTFCMYVKQNNISMKSQASDDLDALGREEGRVQEENKHLTTT